MTAITVIVPTRDRPDDLARCLPSILANEGVDFELIVADQGINDRAEQVTAALDDRRVVYLRCPLTGKSRALNVAVARADGPLIALTDDDCTVPEDWLRRSIDSLQADPNVGITFGSMVPIPHDPSKVHVPRFVPSRRLLLRGTLARAHSRGVAGANMVMRRSVLERLNGFDESLGPGSRFRSGDDIDIAYRALRAGFTVHLDPSNEVTHWGLRPYADGSGQRVLRNNLYGAGAGLAKELRSGDPVALYALFLYAQSEFRFMLGSLLRHRRPHGALRLASLARGFAIGLTVPVDRRDWRFTDRRAARS